MAKEILKIGDTGNDLVSKFNGNFTVTSIERLGYDISLYSCVADGLTDNTTSFNNLLTSIGTSYATLLILGGRYLIGTCIIPTNVDLVFLNGGRIIWAKNSTVNINGSINAGHKWIFENESEVVAELPNIGINQQEWISPVWFGANGDGNASNGTLNYNAIRSAWNSASRASASLNGSSIKLPAGIFYMNGMKYSVDGWDATAKYSNIVGAGRTKTTIILASNQNKSLFIIGQYDAQILDIGFDGNATGNTSMIDPLITINSYRTDLLNIFITNCKADGIHLIPGQLNALHIENILATSITGIALKIIGALNVVIDGIIDIESCGTGIEITGEGESMYDSRFSSRINISGSWYGESLETGLLIIGQCGVRAVFNSYMRTTGYMVHLAYDSMRGFHSMFNYIDIRTTYEPKGIGYATILIDDLCPFNRIFLDHNNFLTDLDGRNDINGNYYCQKTSFQNKEALIYNANTNFATIFAATAVKGSPFNDAIANVASIGGPAHGSSSNLLSYEPVTLGIAGTYYIILVIKAPAGNGSLRFFIDINADEGNYYNFEKKIFGHWNITENMTEFPFDFNGQWQTLSIPISTAVNSAYLRFFFYASTWQQGAFEIAYFGVSNSNDAELIHVKANTVIGYGYNDAIIASTSLPSATEVSVNTKVFCPDLKMEVISDGNNWCKPDGTTL